MALRRRDVLVSGTAVAVAGGCTPVIGAVLPDVELPPLPDLVDRNGWSVPGFRRGEFTRAVSLLNVWASWCPYCRQEHEQLHRLSAGGRFRLLGLAVQDRPAKAADFLRRNGNPFVAVSPDDGRLYRALGRTGLPATYVVDRGGRVRVSVVGALEDRSIQDTIMPAIREALA